MKRSYKNVDDEDDSSRRKRRRNDVDDDSDENYDDDSGAPPKRQGRHSDGIAVISESNVSSHEGTTTKNTNKTLLTPSVLQSELERRARASSQHYERLERRRESNRLSKQRCRGQKRELVATYQAQVQQLSEEFKQLTKEKDELHKELVACLLAAEEEQQKQKQGSSQTNSAAAAAVADSGYEQPLRWDSKNTNTASLLQAAAAATNSAAATAVPTDKEAKLASSQLATLLSLSPSPLSPPDVAVAVSPSSRKKRRNSPTNTGIQAAAAAAAAAIHKKDDDILSVLQQHAASFDKGTAALGAAAASSTTNNKTKQVIDQHQIDVGAASAASNLNFAVGAAVYSSLVAAAEGKAASAVGENRNNNQITSNFNHQLSALQDAVAAAAGLPFSMLPPNPSPQSYDASLLRQDAAAKATSANTSLIGDASTDPYTLLRGLIDNASSSNVSSTIDPLLIMRGMINNSAASNSMLSSSTPSFLSPPTAGAGGACSNGILPSLFFDSQGFNSTAAGGGVGGGGVGGGMNSMLGWNNLPNVAIPPLQQPHHQQQQHHDVFPLLASLLATPVSNSQTRSNNNSSSINSNDVNAQNALELLMHQHRQQQQQQQQQHQEQLLSFLSGSFQQHDHTSNSMGSMRPSH